MKYIKKNVGSECPACKCPHGHLLWSVEASHAAAHFVSSKKYATRYNQLVSHIESLWHKSSCDVISCDSCGFSYSHPYVAGDKVFYDLAYERDGYPTWKWEFQAAFDVISKTVKNRPRILEIGAGDGAFVSRLLDSITNYENVVAIEYSNFGRKKIESLGVRCFSTPIQTLTHSEVGDKFDFICLFQVLEHLDKIDELLRAAGSFLNDDGEIFLAVPNEKRIEFNELNGALLDMPPNHVGRWTEAAFERYAKRSNFVFIEHKREPANFFSEAKRYMKDRHRKRAQTVHSLSHNLLFEEEGFARTLGLSLVILTDAILNPCKIFGLAIDVKKHGGGSQFVRLKKAHLCNA